MRIRSDDVADGATLTAEVVIVGSGPAGIVTALELARRGRSVLLVESGEERYSREHQALGDAGALDPAVHAPLSEAVRRQFGGTSVIWGGRSLPYDRVDFDERPWIPDSHWPLRYEDIQPYFDCAARWLRCGRPVFEASRALVTQQAEMFAGLSDGDVVSSTLERWSLPVNFAHEFGDAINTSERVRLVIGLTCVEIESAVSARSIERLHAKTLDGKSVFLKGAAFVLACGGLESTRLLLVSDRRHPGGIGNHSDLLGRYYMGHVSGRIANVTFHASPRTLRIDFERDREGVYVRRRLSFSRSFLHEQHLPNIVAWPVTPDIGDPRHGNPVLSFSYLALTSPLLGGLLAPTALRRAAVGTETPKTRRAHMRNVLRHATRAASFAVAFGRKRYLHRRRIPGLFVRSTANQYGFHYHGEHVPLRQSRIFLSDKRDALGTRRLAIDLRFSPQDVDGVLNAHLHWDRCLRQHGCGALSYVQGDLRSAVSSQFHEGYHQIGTTRMSTNPVDGVVTSDCNVHGIDNLFVASSSIFVTSSQANPTFTMLAFAVRLAEHMNAQVLT